MAGGMVSLVYFSHARRHFNDAELLTLLRTSRENNARAGVTGILLYHDGNFVQAIEGPRDAVEGVFARIEADPAHEGIIATPATAIEERQFPDWSMGFIPSEALPEGVRRLLTENLISRRPFNLDGIAPALLRAFREGIGGKNDG